MAVTFVAAGATAGAVGNSANIPAPSLVIDDIMVAQIYTNAVLDDVISGPAGWTQIVQGNNTAATPHRYSLWWKRAQAGDSGANHTFTKTGSGAFIGGRISAWRGAGDPDNPFDTTTAAVQTNTTGSTNVTFPAYDPSGSDVQVAFFAFGYNGDITVSFAAAMSSDVNPDCTTRYGSTSFGAFTIGCTSGTNDGTNIVSRTWATGWAFSGFTTGIVLAFNNVVPPPPPVPPSPTEFQLIDGKELYHYRTAPEFSNGNTWCKNTLPSGTVCPFMPQNVRDRWASFVGQSYGQYDGGGMTSGALEGVIETALPYVDNLLWFYSETDLTIDIVVTGTSAWYVAMAAVDKQGRRLIHHNSPGAGQIANAGYINTNLATLESRTFSGYTVYPWDLSGTNVATQIFSTNPVSQATAAAMIAPLFGDADPLEFWVLQFLTNSPDVFDDWTVPIANAANLALAARAAGFKGIFIDNEFYGGYQGRIDYDFANYKATKTLEEYQAQTRLRGKQIADAIYTAWPEAVVLFVYGPWVSLDAAAVALDFNPAIPEANDLLGPFPVGFAQSLVEASETSGGLGGANPYPSYAAQWSAWQVTRTYVAKMIAEEEDRLAKMREAEDAAIRGLIDKSKRLTQ